MNQKLIIRLATVAKLVLAVLICSYFWESTTLLEIRQLPMTVLVMCVVYIGMQMLTRRLSGNQNWWDWVYYVGLICIMVPVSFANEKNELLYHVMTDYGTILLIIPVLVDGWFLIRSNPSEQ
jgi:hypothetical protein